MRLEKHKFLDHLAARGASLKCAFCGNESWEIIIEDPIDIQDQRIMEFAMERIHGGMKVGVVAMVCSNCAFVRMHAVGKTIQQGCPT